MSSFKKVSTLLCILFALWAPLTAVMADDNTDQSSSSSATQVDPAVELPKMQVVLDKIKGQVSDVTDETQLGELNDMAVELGENANTLVQSLVPQSQQVDAQLAVLGPAPQPGSGVKETADVTTKRRQLLAQKARLDDQIKQANALQNGVNVLSSQILNLRRDRLKNQVSLNTGSVLSAKFWQPLYNNPIDGPKIVAFADDLKQSVLLSFSPGYRFGTVMWFIAAVLVMALGRRYMEEFLAWVSINKLSEGRLRRSFLACAIAVTTLLAITLCCNFLALAFARHPDVADDVSDLVSSLVFQSILAGLIAGLGRAFLSTRRPSWRLPVINDDLAKALKPFPIVVATLVFIFQGLEAFNRAIETSVNTTIFGNGLTALLIALLCLMMVIRTRRIRREITVKGEDVERSRIAGLVDIALILTGIIILICLVIGYVGLARYLSYEVIWVGILFSTFYFLHALVIDSCQVIFSTNSAPGKLVIRSLNLSEKTLLQLGSLFSGLFKSALIIMLILLLMNGTISSSSPSEILSRIIDFFAGRGLEKLNLVPSHVIMALVTFIAGIYVVRSIRNWLDSDFLPQTTMDDGMRVSLVTLFSNIGFVLVLLMTLSAIGVQWNKLAWIVSALSVGIGFGLQEIVKNFISGLILLTERPVKVGDLVTISGIEGDIRRINVRATEILLTDKSTVIVPNSQFISQNVRNATMGNAQGVVTIPLTFPLDIDPVKVKEILLGAFADNDKILDTPAPSVSFKDLSAQGILLSVTGNVSSQRLISSTRSELLFEVLVRLREARIALSSPQTMVIEQKPLESDNP
ncbi:DUF3772 domain-containing protein [Rosenbergiella australiborealis]|uniref:DUF3772 domain-containing protein n=1 Tax=Rosenbergiella australiborealis TaxID=1544696 RepID=UPI001F4E848C|nr:DUF3772 domain-containing protein [Rosenbergiella australiborealis]